MVKISGGDGSSFEEAIKISDCSNTEGVKQEYIEVRKKFGNYQLIRQSLQEKKWKNVRCLGIKIGRWSRNYFLFRYYRFFRKGI